MMSWEISSQTWIRASQSSWTALDVPIYNVPEGLNWIQMSFWRALAVLFLFLLAQIKLIPILMLGYCRSLLLYLNLAHGLNYQSSMCLTTAFPAVPPFTFNGRPFLTSLTFCNFVQNKTFKSKLPDYTLKHTSVINKCLCFFISYCENYSYKAFSLLSDKLGVRLINMQIETQNQS